MYSFYNNPYKKNEKSYTTSQNNMNNFDTLQKARQDLVGEIEAVIEYDNHAHNATDMRVRRVWESIRNEELTHVGELMGLINYLDPSQKEYVMKGYKEFEQI